MYYYMHNQNEIQPKDSNVTMKEQVDKIINSVYADKKVLTQKFYSYYKRLNGKESKKVQRATNCGGYMQHKANEDFSKHKLHKANFCKERGCPFCDWRKSIKNAIQITTMASAIEEDFGYEFIFGTLSAVNCSLDSLSTEITRYNHAFMKLMKRQQILKINKGTVRKIEVTYNVGRNDLNLHIHFVMAVNKSYFTSRDYLKREKWLDLWKSVMQDDTIKNIHIQKATKTEGSSSFVELAKYSAKTTDMLSNGFKVFRALMDGLAGRQLITYNGVFKEYNRKFLDGELSKFMEEDKTVYVWLIHSHWNFDERKYDNVIIPFDFEAQKVEDAELSKIRKRLKPFIDASERYNQRS